jgi:hypothetical protein
VHASIWKFTGAPDELLRRYDAIVDEVGLEAMRFHMCLRSADGIVLVDTCPSAEALHAFATDTFPALCRRHGLPAPDVVEDFSVHLALARGERIS